ncbi:hypothetical protein HanXRQr2_Chr13g0568681 [Helianthus annuus]|uniref:Uncharacterized protein n=1 Tax=Helianthus annuus TaxID=4232 RepID=A0A9K3H8N1_HELAN|nr:hypothetical protein HanXRQr2_Chr13g0568681 [Helianthus annuus]
MLSLLSISVQLNHTKANGDYPITLMVQEFSLTTTLMTCYCSSKSFLLNFLLQVSQVAMLGHI